MLRARVLTAALLAAVFGWAVFAWPDWAFDALVALVCAAAAHEWLALAGERRGSARALGAALAALAALAVAQWAPSLAQLRLGAALLSALWLGVFAWLWRLHRSAVPERPQRWTLWLLPWLLLGVALALPWLRDRGGWVLIYVLAIAWAADSGAFFIGRAWGRHKLSPVLSPGKSREGALGGLACAALLALCSAPAFGFDRPAAFGLLFATLVAALFSVGGDLFESALKRAAGVKDSGALLPGHGGVLDRIDSPLASVPAFLALGAALPW